MTDLEMTKLCAEAMGYTVTATENPNIWKCAHEDEMVFIGHPFGIGRYDPLNNNGRAMELVKKHRLTIVWGYHIKDGPTWHVEDTTNADLNRAIVECVAKMQATQAALAPPA